MSSTSIGIGRGTLYCHVTHVKKGEGGAVVAVGNDTSGWCTPIEVARGNIASGVVRYWYRSDSCGSTVYYLEAGEQPQSVNLPAAAPVTLAELPLMRPPCDPEEDVATLTGAVTAVSRLVYALPPDDPAVARLQTAYQLVVMATAQTAAANRALTAEIDPIPSEQGHTQQPPD